MFKSNARPRRTMVAKPEVIARSERSMLTKSASICVDGSSRHMSCTVRDISATGARVSISNVAAVPDTLVLIIRSEDKVARCRVVWRQGIEIGLQFLRSGGMEMEERFKREQAAANAKMMAEIEAKRAAEAQQYRLQQEEQMRIAHQATEQRGKYLLSIGMDPNRRYTEAELKQAYRREAMTRHPDQGGTIEAFQELNMVYRYLMKDAQDPSALGY